MATRTFNAQELINAWNTHSADKVVEHYAENAEMTSPEAPQTIRGKDGLRNNIRGWMSAFPDVTGDIENVCQTGNNVALLVHFSGTHKGALELGPGQTLQPTNKRVEMPVAIFATLDNNGKITKERDVYNMGDLIQQLSIPSETVSKMFASAGPGARAR